jgi:alpha-amylase
MSKKNVNICFYFQVHQPHRLKKYTYFDIGNDHNYDDAVNNKEIISRVARKCYLPTNELLLNLINRYHGAFKVAFSITGTAIEQFKLYSPETLASFKKLADTGCVEFINETYYHSLSSILSKKEFIEQITMHKKAIYKEFAYKATTFRNTELIYNNDIAKIVEELGYKTIITEGADKILDWRSPNFVYRPHECNKINLLLKNYRLSDDIAFRFSNPSWNQFPLTADKFANWAHTMNGKAQLINLFMDYETFGEHQWSETGIFEFMSHLPEYIFKHHDFGFMTPSEASETFSSVGHIDVPHSISWADIERDLTAWKGNSLQEDALHGLYALEEQVRLVNDKTMLATWRMLQTSDHFYYMCTKFAGDGTVHSYFNPYQNPYEAYINFQNILSDFSMELNKKIKNKKTKRRI